MEIEYINEDTAESDFSKHAGIASRSEIPVIHLGTPHKNEIDYSTFSDIVQPSSFLSRAKISETFDESTVVQDTYVIDIARKNRDRQTKSTDIPKSSSAQSRGVPVENVASHFAVGVGINKPTVHNALQLKPVDRQYNYFASSVGVQNASSLPNHTVSDRLNKQISANFYQKQSLHNGVMINASKSRLSFPQNAANTVTLRNPAENRSHWSEWNDSRGMYSDAQQYQ